ncbi:hypothetical protein NIES4074_07530 [Cylindrospermum sp. NIES-4074]|nr:hypothetical protein NIES4074_07530 [Cylindrospermum sp. NIES-4074]
MSAIVKTESQALREEGRGQRAEGTILVGDSNPNQL